MRNQSFAAPFLKSSILMMLVVIGLLACAGAMAADPVYKWKDAKGQSHYSQSPPEGQKYEVITPAGETTSVSPTPGTSTPPAATKPATPAVAHPNLAMRLKNCDAARGNVATLTNNPTAPIDAKGTGKPAQVTPAVRAAELDRAKQQVSQYCD